MEEKKLVEWFREIVGRLRENERVEIVSYNSLDYRVYIAKVVNPMTGNIQVRFELCSRGRFKPIARILSERDLEELKNFVQWLENRRVLVRELEKFDETKNTQSDFNVEGINI